MAARMIDIRRRWRGGGPLGGRGEEGEVCAVLRIPAGIACIFVGWIAELRGRPTRLMDALPADQLSWWAEARFGAAVQGRQPLTAP